VSLGLFIATNLLAATSQRRYVIKRSEGSLHLQAPSKVHRFFDQEDNINLRFWINRETKSLAEGVRTLRHFCFGAFGGAAARPGG
jgi:hypothetical protein